MVKYVSIYEGNVDELKNFQISKPLKIYKGKFELEKKGLDELSDYVLKSLEREAQNGVLFEIQKQSTTCKDKNIHVLGGINYPYFNLEKMIVTDEEKRVTYNIKIIIEGEAILYTRVPNLEKI